MNDTVCADVFGSPFSLQENEMVAVFAVPMCVMIGKETSPRWQPK